ncbi:SulP family inorganic anion transporter [Paludibaculum fermentans]|uniref:SulP family inorganic anion transporter n=1 Tax=Paludibaculum fermentans TaxID=1473598 RepID=UPI003EBCB349
MNWLWTPRDTWKPSWLGCVSGYSGSHLTCDLVAGATAASVALPIGMAVAINSGFPPETGIYSAIVASLCASLLGGSRFQIGGPSAAFVFFSPGVVRLYGVHGLQMLTLMAGFMLIFLGLTRLGSAVKLLPAPVLIGFANGIAILIAAKQVGLVLGWGAMGEPGETLPLLMRFIEHPSSANPVSCAVAVGSLIVILLARKVTKRLPGSLIALVTTAGAVRLFDAHVETIGNRFGGIPAGLPAFTLPFFHPDLIAALLVPAFAAAILIAMESLMAAAVTDVGSGDRHNSGAELVSQGVSNFLVPMFGGIPVAGAVARTLVNARSGANTPLAGLVHVITLSLVLVFGAPLAGFVPIATLAVVMLVLAFNLSLWREALSIIRLDLMAKISWTATLVLTISAGLTVTVEAMLVLAVLHCVQRVSVAARETGAVVSDKTTGTRVLDVATILSGMSEGADHKPSLIGRRYPGVEKLAPIVILSMEDIATSDLDRLEGFCDSLKDSGRVLLICGISRQSPALKRHPEFVEHIGMRNVLPHLPAAIRRASEISDRFLGVGERLAHSLAEAAL